MFKRVFLVLMMFFVHSCCWAGSEGNLYVEKVAQVPGLIAFWDFLFANDSVWQSRYDSGVVDRSYPVYLRRIGDPNGYRVEEWPYSDEPSKLVYDASGPFGNAMRFNKGYVYAEVPREEFDGTALDITGKRSFTMVSWVKFVGKRHLVSGVWDEGGWDRYAGRRQYALFAGLAGSDGVIGHISTTGAASYPQSKASGSQYARNYAIDGQGFKNGQWIAMAMTYDAAKGLVTAYLNGVATEAYRTDPVVQDVYGYDEKLACNPFLFGSKVYSPWAFTLKYNGYRESGSGVYEHRLFVDTVKRVVTYEMDCMESEVDTHRYAVEFQVKRNGKLLYSEPVRFEAIDKASHNLPDDIELEVGDEIVTSLYRLENGELVQVGTELHRRIEVGAPFTFGRALGLGKGDIEHGSQLFIDGVAVFNRVLDESELEGLAFVADKDASVVELLKDKAFRNGLTILSPEPGKKTVVGAMKAPFSKGSPHWSLCQWNSRYDVSEAKGEAVDKKTYRQGNEAKEIVISSGEEGRDLVLSVDSRPEYDGVVRKSGQAWPHLLVQQDDIPIIPLRDIERIGFSIEAKLLKNEREELEGYSKDLHSAQFMVTLIVQNRNQASEGYGDFIWFNVAMYDERVRFCELYASMDTADASAKMIYAPAIKAFSKETLHGGRWVRFGHKDLSAFFREGLDLARTKGYLKTSPDNGDFAISSVILGWEVTGVNDVSMQVRDFGISVYKK